MTLPNPDGRLSKRGKLAAYFTGSGASRHMTEYPPLDNGANDYQAVNDAILNDRRKSYRTQIQEHNSIHSQLVRLPTEVLLQIFKHLEKGDLFSLLTVCRVFADLIVEILWFRPNMQSDATFDKIRAVMQLPRHDTHWDYRNYIKRLNLSFMTKHVDDDLLGLFAGCPKLERLTLVNCTQVTHMPIARILHYCSRLQSIDMTGVLDIQDDIIYALAQHCPRLQGLYAPGCGNASEEAVLALLRACPMLKRIKFNNSEAIGDDSILAMYDNCKLLVEIDLHNCPNVSDKHLRCVFAELTQLREFRISNAAGITDNLFELVPEDFVLDKLRIIDVTGCNAITDRLVERMVKYAPRLRNVVLSKCMQITDASLRHLTKLGRSLHYIHLGHCASVTDFGVQALVRNCHRIQYIDLACCSQLTDWTLIELSALPKLRRIGLVKCNMITDSGIMELVRRRGEQDCLERVHLSYCTNLTIGPIYCLLKSCPRLTHLSLTGIAAFLRHEITQYCRDPPQDFTENQKSSFCVFSGHGVVQLRNYLASLMDQRAFILEQFAYTNNNQGGNPMGPLGIQAAAHRGARDPSPNGITPSPPNEVLGAPAFPVRPDRIMPLPLNDGEMQAWAQSRGIAELQRNFPNQPEQLETNESRFNETDAILRQLLTLEQQNRQRLATFQNAARMFSPESASRGLGIRPLNAPQIAQPPMLGEEVNRGEPEDIDMMAVDLFSRAQDRHIDRR